ncbi:RsmD family RNA methyltransferase [Fuerstiella marisgermanici]|uniref:Ribosomal RNA small subunit methyltransferase D n=1 Tax=Fuerstiella marisgermanici TaxID=1891926 RepID=A0A1P8WGK9_9PLAN|nr:RsmD family RNA methyltransferase [Fuerstiella marisgermanici]APZ93177.1 Ribosomal RNA small subunit methyltransferase D [Fuerstiella marisgermanici]
MSLRIIGGEYGRRRLKTPPTQTTRPYTERVRQGVFDRISPIIEQSRVADVFSGVGTMGLEALSRGAASCVFIEGDSVVHEALSNNVSTIAPDRKTVCWKTNIHRTSFCPNGGEECLPYSLVFFDPPYDQCPLLKPHAALGKCLSRLAKPRVTSDDAMIILRTPGRFEFSECSAWRIDDCWRISTMNLWILKKPNTGPDAEPVEPDAGSAGETNE